MELVDRYFGLLRAKYTIDGDDMPGDDISVNFDLIDDWAWRCGLSVRRFLDEIAIRMARGFDCGEFSYEFCDAVVNDLYGVCVHERMQEFPPLFWEIYEAFDAGEYYRKPDQSDDPVAEHTIPMIKATLAKCPP